MTARDVAGLVLEALRVHRLRSGLTMLGIVIGMAAVVLMSSIGEGARKGVMAQFSQFGTTIVQVQPGQTRTLGVSPGALGGTTHPLTIDDALALRRVRGVRFVAPHVVGMGEVEARRRSRHTYVYGTTADDLQILGWSVRVGTFLPSGDPEQAPPVCVLGATVARELFPDRSPLGARVRIGEAQFRVVGVMASKGQMLGFDLDDMVYVPVRRAMAMFDRQGVSEVHALIDSHARIEPAMRDMARVLRERHDGDEDVTITSQADMLSVVEQVLSVLTAGVLAIAAISVLVGALGILTIQWVSVHERTAEVGLMKALGASRRQIVAVFLAEAAGLSSLGGLAGGLAGAGLAFGLDLAAAAAGVELHARPPAWAVPTSIFIALAVGVLAGVLPALRAADLDAIEALRAE
jgi:putative ABC transport system permease protein